MRRTRRTPGNENIITIRTPTGCHKTRRRPQSLAQIDRPNSSAHCVFNVFSTSNTFGIHGTHKPRCCGTPLGCRLLYYNQLKFPECTSVCPAGRMIDCLRQSRLPQSIVLDFSTSSGIRQSTLSPHFVELFWKLRLDGLKQVY